MTIDWDVFSIIKFLKNKIRYLKNNKFKTIIL